MDPNLKNPPILLHVFGELISLRYAFSC